DVACAYAGLLSNVLRELGGVSSVYGITAVSICAHIAADVITSYGTMVFAPFSDWRVAIGTTFIIDLWFSGIIVAGLIASAIVYRSRRPAIAALAVLVAYVGFQYLQREHALEFAAQHARPGTHIDAQPRPVSP